jgi:hypothetical protein
MAKSTIKVKHLGIMSTGRFMAVYTFLLSLVQIALGVVMMVFYLIVGLIFGLGSGDSNALGAVLLLFGGSLIGFIITAVLAVVGMTVLGFLIGAIGAFVFNIGVKLSGGLRLDAEIEGKG